MASSATAPNPKWPTHCTYQKVFAEKNGRPRPQPRKCYPSASPRAQHLMRLPQHLIIADPPQPTHPSFNNTPMSLEPPANEPLRNVLGGLVRYRHVAHSRLYYFRYYLCVSSHSREADSSSGADHQYGGLTYPSGAPGVLTESLSDGSSGSSNAIVPLVFINVM